MEKKLCLNKVTIKNYNFNDDIINSIKNAIDYDISQLDKSERTNTFEEHVKSLEIIFSYFINNIRISCKNEEKLSFSVYKNSNLLLLVELHV